MTIRQRDGALRTADAAERDRFVQVGFWGQVNFELTFIPAPKVFFSEKHKKERAPDGCKPPHIYTLLEDYDHANVLDIVSKRQHPYQRDYVLAHRTHFLGLMHYLIAMDQVGLAMVCACALL